MGKLGWSPPETDLMEVWQVGMFLGSGETDPVIRGSQSLTVGDKSRTPGQRPADPHVLARIRAYEAREAAAQEADET